MALSISAAARSAGIDRGTWTGLERGHRATEDYVYARIEKVLAWKPGSIDNVLGGGDPEQLAPAADRGTTGAADDTAELDFELDMIEASDLPRGMKNAMIREAQRLRRQQLADQEAFQRRQEQERREEVGRWLRIAGEGNALT